MRNRYNNTRWNDVGVDFSSSNQLLSSADVTRQRGLSTLQNSFDSIQRAVSENNRYLDNQRKELLAERESSIQAMSNNLSHQAYAESFDENGIFNEEAFMTNLARYADDLRESGVDDYTVGRIEGGYNFDLRKRGEELNVLYAKSIGLAGTNEVNANADMKSAEAEYYRQLQGIKNNKSLDEGLKYIAKSALAYDPNKFAEIALDQNKFKNDKDKDLENRLGNLLDRSLVDIHNGTESVKGLYSNLLTNAVEAYNQKIIPEAGLNEIMRHIAYYSKDRKVAENAYKYLEQNDIKELDKNSLQYPNMYENLSSVTGLKLKVAGDYYNNLNKKKEERIEAVKTFRTALGVYSGDQFGTVDPKVSDLLHIVERTMDISALTKNIKEHDKGKLSFEPSDLKNLYNNLLSNGKLSKEELKFCEMGNDRNCLKLKENVRKNNTFFTNPNWEVEINYEAEEYTVPKVKEFNSNDYANIDDIIKDAKKRDKEFKVQSEYLGKGTSSSLHQEFKYRTVESMYNAIREKDLGYAHTLFPNDPQLQKDIELIIDSYIQAGLKRAIKDPVLADYKVSGSIPTNYQSKEYKEATKHINDYLLSLGHEQRKTEAFRRIGRLTNIVWSRGGREVYGK